MKKAVVLLSGGLDSTTLLHYVVRKLGYDHICALTVLYGQKHNREIDAAKWQCEHLPEVRDWKTIDIALLADLIAGSSALTDDNIEVPALSALTEDQLTQPPTYVPNRNMIMLSLAAAYAESNGCDEIFYGAQAQDEYGYWDCTPEFIDRVNQVLNLNRRNHIEIKAPFVNMRKSEELSIGLKLGIDYSQTWTCYRGGEKACGECPTCVERLKAFSEAGATDPLQYE